MATGRNIGHVGQQNRGLVLQMIATGRGATRVEIAQETGLSKMAVGNIISQLMEEGFLEEGPAQSREQTGRRPLLLQIGRASPQVLGLYLSRDGITGLVCDIGLAVSHREYLPLSPHENQDTVVGKLLQVCGALLRRTKRPILGIGVSAIGPVDVAGGMLHSPTNFFGIETLDLAGPLGEQFGYPVAVHNDMRAAALAELYFGSGRGYGDFLYVGITNGVGSAIVVGGQLYRHDSELWGEMGHTSVDILGERCSCGRRGCLELYASIPRLTAQLQQATGQQGELAQLCRHPAGEPVLAQMTDYLACAITNQVNMLGPQAVVVGHQGALLPQKWLDRLAEQVNGQKLWGNYREVVFERAYFAELSPAFGGVCCWLRKLFGGETDRNGGDRV